jgi:hypothetical protein
MQEGAAELSPHSIYSATRQTKTQDAPGQLATTLWQKFPVRAHTGRLHNLPRAHFRRICPIPFWHGEPGQGYNTTREVEDMTLLIEANPVPLQADPDGTIRESAHG